MVIPDALIRISVFVALVAALGLVERLRPRHLAAPHRRRRWPVNFALGAIDALAVRILMPWLAVDAARWAQDHGTGLLPWLGLATAPSFIVAILALDCIIYGQHRLMHRVGPLWRLHRVHHTDVSLDLSSAVRFHPLEMLFSMLIKIAAVLALGAPPGAVLTFEVLLSAFALFTHANVALPATLDRLLRVVFVTPDMHRIHHSVRPEEYDRNFGFHASWWDRLFGTYLRDPRTPQATMRIGLERFRAPADQRLVALLTQPLAPP